MRQAQPTASPRCIRLCYLLVFLSLICVPASRTLAQDDQPFDPIAASATVDEINFQLSVQSADTADLAEARTEVVSLDAAAANCRLEATEERDRLQALFDPLDNIDGTVSPSVFDQRNEIRRELDLAIARQTLCKGLKDDTEELLARITGTQNQLSQQFLLNRGKSVLALLRELPERIASLPAELRSSVSLNLPDQLTPLVLFWLLIVAGSIAAAIGVLLRRRFYRWYEAAGGDDAPARMKYLFPKPLAEYAPLLLEGLALVAVLLLAIEDSSMDFAVVRLAAGIFLYGFGCVVIDWATGPLSPSARVKGLIPEHVRPLRGRLRFFILTLVASFVVLGTDWLAIRTMDPDASGRATMIFLVAISLLYVIRYLGRIPGIQGRIRFIRYAGSLALIVGIGALLIGFQNFAGYLIHGVTRTALALSVLWILLWATLMAFDFLMRQDSPGATQLRASLGVSERASRSGLGFMQLIADLVVWLSFLVYLIYVWDESGTTLDRLVELVVLGGTVGNIQLVPLNIIGGILVFAALLVLIGWMKRWIDRRWLQHIVIERGAREALITLFGYVGFIVAVLIGLTQAGVELGGLVFVSTALAFGIGIGMQEIANNFVSGLILLFERPIRPGDFVSVADIEGSVRSIRIRATEIETLDNQNVLVPNSELVSGRVTNWVLRDTYGRLQIVVGVAYGSDVEKVRDILESIAHEHPEVITDGRAPAPRALFIGFGDSSLDFELRIRIDRIDRRFSVQSDINFAIDAAFREAGITIPFPQRDLHVISYPKEEAKEKLATKPQPAPPKKQQDHGRSGVFPQLDNITRSHREEVELSAGIDEVWTAITDIESINRWLAKDGKFAARIGGRFELLLRDDSDLSGRIDIFLPPRRMRLVIALREGDELLESGPATIDFSLRDKEEKTTLTVSVSGIPATEEWEEDYRRSENLWKTSLVELQELLTRS